MTLSDTNSRAKRLFLKTYLGTDEVRAFDPLPPGHPAVGRECFLCRQAIKAGDITCLIPTYPAGLKEWIKWYNGRPYNANATIAHYDCVFKLAQEKKGQENDNRIDPSPETTRGPGKTG